MRVHVSTSISPVSREKTETRVQKVQILLTLLTRARGIGNEVKETCTLCTLCTLNALMCCLACRIGRWRRVGQMRKACCRAGAHQCPARAATAFTPTRVSRQAWHALRLPVSRSPPVACCWLFMRRRIQASFEKAQVKGRKKGYVHNA